MSIILSGTQTNSATSSEPEFQEWGPTQPIYLYWSNNNVSPLFPPLIPYRIKDVVGHPSYTSYSEFRLRAWRVFEPSVYAWISNYPSGVPTDQSSTIPITENGMTSNFMPLLTNLELLENGVYNATQCFQIEGKNSVGSWVTVSSFEHLIRLTVTDDLATFSPSSIHFEHYQNTPSQTHTITMDGLVWALLGRPHLVLSSSTPGVTIETVYPVIGDPYPKASGTGPAQVAVALSSFYDSGLPDPSTLSGQMKILSGTTIVGSLSYTISIIHQLDMTVFPTAINFLAVRGLEEAAPQPIYLFTSQEILNSEGFEFSGPPWVLLELGEAPVGNSGTLPAIIVTPIPSINLEVGTLTGTVMIEAVVLGVPRQFPVTVIYQVSDYVSTPYGNDFAFTLDPLFMGLSTTEENTYFQMFTTVIAYDFFTGNAKTLVIPEKFPLFQGRQKFNVGKKVHQIMNRFGAPNDEYLQYRPAEVSFLAIEKAHITNEEVRTTQIAPMLFIAGLKPEDIADKPFILDFNLRPKRVTRASYDILNFTARDQYCALIIEKNGIEAHTEVLLPSSGWICCKKILFDAFSPGDEITARIQSLDTEELFAERAYVVFPENIGSTMVIWENEFLLQSALEFTGAYSIKSDFEPIGQTLYKNLVEVLEHLEVKKKNQIAINTGWLTQNDVDSIESLCRSRRVWLMVKDQWIQALVVSKTIANYDTERDLIEFTIEFQINRDYDEKAYSF